METRQIEKQLSRVGPCRVLPIDWLKQLRATGHKMGIVVNTDRSNQPGEHWVAIYLNGTGKGQYFCSFGLPPLHKEIIDFMNRSCPAGWSYNNVTVQQIDETICGNLCIAFLKAKFGGVKYSQFIAQL